MTPTFELPEPVVSNQFSYSEQSKHLARERLFSQKRSFNTRYVIQHAVTVIPLVLVDLLSFMICFFWGSTVANGLLGEPVDCTWLAVVLGIHVLICFYVLELYDGVGMHPVFEFRQSTLGLGLLFILVSSSLIFSLDPRILAVAITFPMLILVMPVMRSLLRGWLATCSWWGIRALVFSAHRRVNRLLDSHFRNVASGVKPVGFMQPEVPSNCLPKYRDLYLGGIEEADQFSGNLNAHCAIVHRFGRTDRELFAFVEQHLSQFSRVLIHPDDPRLPSLWLINRNGGFSFRDRLKQPMYRLIKRSMDLVISLAVLLVTWPLFLAIMLWIKSTSRGNVFFGHERIGLEGQKFKAWKFRTMIQDSEYVLRQCLAESPEMQTEWETTGRLKNDPRLTLAGRLLRKTSLDQLPQLWNVIKGEMSLVGPRPIVAKDIEKYDEALRAYLRVTPGVTGLWQVSGRNLTSYDRRVELDEFYVRNWSPWFDIYILGRTVKTVLFREGRA